MKTARYFAAVLLIAIGLLSVSQASYVQVGKSPPGTVITTASTSCPTYTIPADGSSLLRAGTYAALFAAISTTYGSADGTHFTVPNAKGVFVRGAGSQVITALTYTGTQGTSQNDTTKKNGLTIVDPGHTHLYNGSTAGGVGSTNMAGGAINTNNNTDSATTGVTVGAGDAETRPANISLLYCIYF